MGMIKYFGGFLGAMFGGGRNVVAETIGAVIPNAEGQSARDHARALAAIEAASRESSPGGFVGGVIALVRALPRPLMAFGVLGLFVFAMASPDAFGVRMTALALVPEPLWLLLGAVVAFYFGARSAEKIGGVRLAQSVADLQAWRAASADIAPEPLLVPEPLPAPEALPDAPGMAAGDPVERGEANPALDLIRARGGRG